MPRPTPQFALSNPADAGFIKRIAGLVVLLVAELLILSQLLDSRAVSGRTWWAILLRKSPNAFQAASAAAALLLVIVTPQLCSLWRSHHERFGSGPALARQCLIWHAVAYIAFGFLSGLMFRGDLHERALPELWTLAWSVFAAATAATWVLTLIPREFWATYIPRFLLTACATLPFGLLAWAAGRASRELWDSLTALTFMSVKVTLEVLGQDCSASIPGSQVGTATFQVAIHQACSGYQGIGLTVAFLVAYLAIFHRDFRFPHAFLLLPLATITSWCANIIRIALLIVIGTHVSRDAALGGFHSQAGWILVCGIGIGTVVIGQRILWMRRQSPPRRQAINSTAAGSRMPAAFVLPFLASLAAGMIGAMGAAIIDLSIVLRVAAAATALCFFRHSYREILRIGIGPESLVLGIGTAMIWIAVHLLSATGELSSPTSPWNNGDDAWRPILAAVWCLNAFLFVPLVEELAFRGYLLRRLQDLRFEAVPATQFSWPSVLISSVLFGLLHPNHWIAGSVAGLAYAAAVLYRGRLLDAVSAHCITNVLLGLYCWTTGDWRAWG